MKINGDLKRVNKGFIVILILIFFGGGPFVINTLYKYQAPNKYLVAAWDAGDALSYYGSVLLGAITIYLAFVAISQTKYANKVNRKLLRMEEINKQSYLKLNLQNSTIEKLEGDSKWIKLQFENLTDNIIVDFEIKGSNQLLIDTVWKQNQVSKEGAVATEFMTVTGDGLIEQDKKMHYSIHVKELSPFMLVSFCVKMKSIYGFENIQHFNIICTKNVINGYKTMVLNGDIEE